ncbi:MAG: MBL fold metallo-hydrolase [Thermoproteus sp.]|nr:MBL fold metallo-hydrolase [Thermoproteus sp.]
MPILKLLFLGTGGAVPRVDRALSGIYIEDWGGNRILLDASEGVQYRLLENKISPASLDVVAVTHAHEDHVLGLPGILSTASLLGKRLKVLAPPSLRESLKKSGVEAYGELELGRLKISCVEVCHTVEACGWLLEWDIGYKLDLGKVKELPRQALTRLIRGEAVEHEGVLVRPEDVAELGHRRLRRLFYTGDTAPCPTAWDKLGRVDVLIHEATFADDVEPAKAHGEGHSTVADAVEAAIKLGASLLIVTHISSRYDDVSRHERALSASGLAALMPRDGDWLLLQL